MIEFKVRMSDEGRDAAVETFRWFQREMNLLMAKHPRPPEARKAARAHAVVDSWLREIERQTAAQMDKAA